MWELLDTVYEGANCETRAQLEGRDFVLKPLMRHAIFLSGWLRIHMNLRLVVLILTSYPLAYLIMPLLRVRYDHDSTSCPYDISDDGFTRLSSKIRTMNKQQVEFANKRRSMTCHMRPTVGLVLLDLMFTYAR